jgi:tRNA (guanine37-N1)-methyltransferase
MKEAKINFYIITLFPDSMEKVFSESIIGRAQKKGLIKINFIDLRKFGEGKHKQVDDTAYGGGAGMVLRVDIIDKAIKSIKRRSARKILLTPQGKVFNQRKAKKLSAEKNIILICGHYEGFDERVRGLVDEEISIGDFVLTGGEIPAMAIVDSVSRLIPGVLGKKDSLKEESFEDNMLEYPQYTYPRVYKKNKVPEVLLSGNHKEIKEWRKSEAEKRTKKRRPDLLK